MIRSVKHLKRFDIVATDGSIGSVDDFYFDDERWTIRYLIVDTGKWLPGRRVLVSPYSVVRTEHGEQRLLLSISRQQLKDSPGVDTEKPVSRQHEADYLRYYGYPFYWAHTGLWGAYPTPLVPNAEHVAKADAALNEELRAQQSSDSRLRSAEEVAGYMLRATDGELGHIDDFLIDDGNWALRYFVINTSNWWFGQKVLAAPSWITSIDWATKTVHVNVTRDAIRTAPQYDRAEHIDQQWEAAYHQHVRGEDDLIEGDEAAPVEAARDYARNGPERAPGGVERRARAR